MERDRLIQEEQAKAAPAQIEGPPATPTPTPQEAAE
jgi:hypothetical protein